MAKCLVTGGAGFIGSHVVDALVRDGHTVRILDNLSTGNLGNLSGLRGRVDFTEGDVCDLETVRRAMRGTDLVFHMAALTSVPQSVADPLETHRVCATGTLNVLTASQECEVRRFVYAACSSAYGNSDQLSKRESDSPLPLSPYSAAKLAGEQYCRTFGETYGLETVCLRYFHVFGPRQEPGGPYAGVIPSFIDSLLDGDPPVIYGNGFQSRDFTYVENVVRGTVLAAEAPAAAGKVYNIACGQSVTLVELVAALNDIIGSNLAPEFILPRVVDVHHSQADISLARAELGFEPLVGFEEGLRRCVEQYRARRSATQRPARPAGANRILVVQGS